MTLLNRRDARLPMVRRKPGKLCGKANINSIILDIAGQALMHVIGYFVKVLAFLQPKWYYVNTA